MLVIALCTACFSRVKINKKRWLPTFRIDLPNLNALAPALCGELVENVIWGEEVG